MNEQQQQQQEPSVNGVPLSVLPEYARKLFDKVMSLRDKETSLQSQLVATRGALEEFANLLAQEVENFKATAGVVTATDPTTSPTDGY